MRHVGAARVEVRGVATRLFESRPWRRVAWREPMTHPLVTWPWRVLAIGFALHVIGAPWRATLLILAAVVITGWLAMSVDGWTGDQRRWWQGTSLEVHEAWHITAGLAWLLVAVWTAPWSLWSAFVGMAVMAVVVPVWVIRHRRNDEPTAVPPIVDLWRDRVDGGGVLPGTEIIGVEPTGLGQRLTITLPPRTTIADVLNATERIAGALMLAHAASITVDQGRTRSEASITLFPASPLNAPQPWIGAPIVAGMSPIGVYADGSVAHWRWWRPGSGAVHDLIGGVTGSGKSGTIRGLLRTAYDAPEICTLLLDPKMGQSAPAWLDHVEGVVLGPEPCIRALEDVAELIESRSLRLGRLRLSDFDPLDARHGMPLLWVLLDEAPMVMKAGGEYGSRARKAVETIVTTGRSAGVKLTFIAQAPTLDQVGSNAAREQMQAGNILSLRIGRISAQMAAGSTIAALAAAIPRSIGDLSTAGRAYLQGDDERPVELRTQDPATIPDPALEGPTVGPTVIDAMTARFLTRWQPTQAPVVVEDAPALDVPEIAHVTAGENVLAAIRQLVSERRPVTNETIRALTPYSRSKTFEELAKLVRSGALRRAGDGTYYVPERKAS